MKIKILIQILILLSINVIAQQQNFVNVNVGNDNNVGTKENPLKTIKEATRRVNNNDKMKPQRLLFLLEDILLRRRYY